MSLLDLFRSRDGSMSQTKTFATLFHALLFLTVAVITFRKMQFDQGMWTMYGGFALLHAGYDKTMATIKDFKDRKLQAESPNTTDTVIIQANGN